ncbi:MAG: C-GCAxxG-C-C family protein [Bacteroidales bacterium]|nr:C-GCAxxG-C-C family protein [Candidatus Latescibacterota bacterium]
MDKTKKSIEYFEKGFACSQSVFAPWAEGPPLDKETALKIASSFGGGMGGMGGVCGAVTGAFMVLGLHFGRTEAGQTEIREKNYALVKEFARRFREKHGSLECNQLLGVDISTPEGYDSVHANREYFEKCLSFVRSASEILEDLIV